MHASIAGFPLLTKTKLFPFDGGLILVPVVQNTSVDVLFITEQTIPSIMIDTVDAKLDPFI